MIALDVLDPYRWDWPVASDPETIKTLAKRMAGGRGFEIARGALSSSVQRLDRSVYELDEHEVGQFDLVYVGSLLIHLRDPVRAIERIRSVCRGTLIVVDGIDLGLTLRAPRMPVARLDGRGRPWWWYPNAAALGRVVEAGGFRLMDRPRRLFVPAGQAWALERWAPQLLRTRDGREALTVAWLGDPHAIVVGTPQR